eukprot:PhF_6_TR19292/c0_g1_i1/m.28361
MSNAEFVCSSVCYAKALLHANQHPSQTVIGVLVGTRSDKTVEVKDCFPILHSNFNLKPLSQIAVLQIKAMAQSEGMEIVGSYAANERLSDNDSNEVARTLCKNADAIHWQITNGDVPQAAVKVALRAFVRNEKTGQWVEVEGSRTRFIGTELPTSRLLRALEAKAKVVDIEDFLENPTLDVTNPGI